MPSTPVTVEPGRLSRAMELAITREGENEYMVRSRSRPNHWHDVKLDRDPVCHCEDSWYRGRRNLVCQHELAARLQRAAETGDENDPVLLAAGLMLLRRERARES